MEELNSRKQLFIDCECANIEQYNKLTDCNFHRIVFACDEIAELLDKTGLDKESKVQIAKIESLLSTIARQGRAFGIHLILATQRPDADILKGQNKNNIDFRIAVGLTRCFLRLFLITLTERRKFQRTSKAYSLRIQVCCLRLIILMIANGELYEKLCDYGEVLTVKDVQNILGIGRNAVYQMLKNGTLKSKRIGTKYIIPKKSIQTYLNSCF